jgi:lipoate-protein ligase A
VHEATVNEDLLSDFERKKIPQWRIYEPCETIAVLGAAGNPSRDLILDNLTRDGVPHRFRRGGGGAVILSPGQVVLALVTEVDLPFANREYARRINSWFMEALSGTGIGGIEQRGISDLAIRGKKVLGTSIYRRRLILFYQASLLVSNDVSLFDRYLSMPARAPDYRGGRRHGEFCTTLRGQGFNVTTADTKEALAKVVERRIGGLRCADPPRALPEQAAGGIIIP